MKTLIYFSAYSYYDIFKQRFFHMLPYLQNDFDEIIIIDAISSYKDKIIGLKNNIFFPNSLKLIDNFENVFVYRHFLTIPNKICVKFPILYKLNYFFLKKAIKKLSDHFLNSETIIGTSHPYMYNGVFEVFRDYRTFYDCPDLHEEFPWANKKTSIKLEKNIINDVKVFTCSSNFISKVRHEQMGRLAKVISNGVTVKDFQDNDHINVDKNKVGYVGALEDWFDFQLLDLILSDMKEINFEIIGNVPTNKIQIVQKLISKHENVKFTGQIKHNELIEHMKYWKVGIIPFKMNKLISGVSPIKLFEYCSVGIETVSLYWDELDYYKGYIYTANNNFDFLKLLKETFVKNLNETRIKELKEFAYENSWENKTKQFVDLLKNA